MRRRRKKVWPPLIWTACREWLSCAWATARETALWPADALIRAYTANRKAAIEGMIDSDLIAVWARELMSG
jgi:hypothetical protein